MNENNYIIKTIDKGEYTEIAVKGTAEQVLNSCKGIFYSILKGENLTKDKKTSAKFKAGLMNTLIEAYLDVDPDSVLIVYDELINGILEKLSEAEESKSKYKFLNTLTKITSEAFKKFKKEHDDKNEKSNNY